MNRVLLIIPAYNEKESIIQTIVDIRKYQSTLLQRSTEYVLDYVVINDGSTDSTEKICREKQIPIISLSQNLGIGGAVQTGYKYALLKQYDVAVQFDGDGQHDILSLDQLVLPILHDEADFTVGSRFCGQIDGNFQSTALRRFGIKFLSFIILLFGRLRILDCTSGYRGAGKVAIEYLSREYPEDYPEPESLVRLSKRDIRICEVPVKMFERTGGQSSIRAWKSVYYMIKVALAIIIASTNPKGERR